MAGCYNKTARIWTLEDGACKMFYATSGSILSIAFLPKRLIVLGCGDGSIEVWTTEGKNKAKLMETIVGDKYAVKSLAFVELAGKQLVIATEDASLKYLDVTPLFDTNKALEDHRKMAGGKPLVQCMTRINGNKVYMYPSHILPLLIPEAIIQGAVTSLAVSPDRKWVVSGSDDHCIRFFDLETATLHIMIQGHNDSVTSLDLSQTGKCLLTGGKDGKVRMCTFLKFYFII